MALHFVGFRGDEYARAVRVFGVPDFVHIGWDRWARQEVVAGDVAVFAAGTAEDVPSPYSYPDLRETAADEPPRGRGRPLDGGAR